MFPILPGVADATVVMMPAHGAILPAIDLTATLVSAGTFALLAFLVAAVGSGLSRLRMLAKLPAPRRTGVEIAPAAVAPFEAPATPMAKAA